MNTSKFVALTSLVAALVVLSGCSSVKVTTDYNHAAAFGQYQTYTLEPPNNGPSLSPTAETALRDSVREDMAKRGISEVGPNEKPDLAVVPRVKFQQKYSVVQYTSWGWPYYGGYYLGGWAGSPYTYNTINSYTEGTLILDFLDTSNQKLVFRGTGVTTVSGHPEKNTGKIRKAVEKIVAKLPEAPSAPVGGSF